MRCRSRSSSNSGRATSRVWAIKALRDEPLELFATAKERERRTIAEIVEPEVALCPMTSQCGVERTTGTSACRYAVPRDVPAQGFHRAPHRNVRGSNGSARRQWLMTAGLALVRQKPGSAKGLCSARSRTKRRRRPRRLDVALRRPAPHHPRAASLMAVKGHVHREGEVVHLCGTPFDRPVGRTRGCRRPGCRLSAAAWASRRISSWSIARREMLRPKGLRTRGSSFQISTLTALR
jgi:hypothetical protein